jgi:hypothetical protein
MRDLLKQTIVHTLNLSLALILVFSHAEVVQSENMPPGFTPPAILTYDVTYAGGRIAVVEFTESKPYSYKGQRVRELECRVESSGLFNLDGLYRSVVTDDYSLVYLRSDEGPPGDKRIVEYHFDYRNKSAAVIDNRIKGTDTTSTTRHLKNIDKRYFDSISMIFKIRYGVDTMKAPMYIPLFIEGSLDSVLIESISEVKTAGPDGVPVDAYLINARMPYPPYPGFGDRIEIYISRDKERTPLRGRLEMALGYIEIKLRPR